MSNRLEYIIAETMRFMKIVYVIFSFLCLLKCLITGVLGELGLLSSMFKNMASQRNCAGTSRVLHVSMRIKSVAAA